MQECKQVVAKAQDNPHLFRRLKVMLLDFLASVNDHDRIHDDTRPVTSHDFVIVRAPVAKSQKRERSASKSDENLSAYYRSGSMLSNTTNFVLHAALTGLKLLIIGKAQKCPFMKKSVLQTEDTAVN